MKAEGELKTKTIKYSWVLELHIIKDLFILPQSETQKQTVKTYTVIKQNPPACSLTPTA